MGPEAVVSNPGSVAALAVRLTSDGWAMTNYARCVCERERRTNMGDEFTMMDT